MKTLILILALSLAGCAKVGTIQHPGAVNLVDDRIYSALLDTRAAVEAAKAEVATHPALKDILNAKVIPPFNDLESAYIAYHNALVAGQSPDATALQAQISAVTAALADALKTVGAKP